MNPKCWLGPMHHAVDIRRNEGTTRRWWYLCWSMVERTMAKTVGYFYKTSRLASTSTPCMFVYVCMISHFISLDFWTSMHSTWTCPVGNHGWSGSSYNFHRPLPSMSRTFAGLNRYRYLKTIMPCPNLIMVEIDGNCFQPVLQAGGAEACQSL